jgi:hypothetical protein
MRRSSTRVQAPMADVLCGPFATSRDSSRTRTLKKGQGGAVSGTAPPHELARSEKPGRYRSEATAEIGGTAD